MTTDDSVVEKPVVNMPDMPPTIMHLYDDKISIPFEIAPGISKDREVSLDKFIDNFSSQALIDTGLLPVSGTGLLALRQFGKYRQITYQIDAGMNLVTWGNSESQREKPTFFVASPYRIIIADIFDGDLLGARMFYSTEPISAPNQVLNHINLPNVNCKGYQGNGVGWLCLYLKESWRELDIASQVHAIVERAGGGEAYNDANMRSTDGARFYASYKKDETYLYNPKAWAKKSKEEGWEWTLEPNLWLPIKVKDVDEQGNHSDDGIPYTIDMAMRGKYNAYYTDATPLKPINAASRTDAKITDSINSHRSTSSPFSMRAVLERSIIMNEPYGLQCRTRPIVNAEDNWETPVWAAGSLNKFTASTNEAVEQIAFKPKKIGTCTLSGQDIYEGMDSQVISFYGLVLKELVTDDLFVNDKDGNLLHKESSIYITGADEPFYVTQTVGHGTCNNCGLVHIIHPTEITFYAENGNGTAYCKSCAIVAPCAITGVVRPVSQLQSVEALDPTTGEYKTYHVSNEHFSEFTKCLCDLLVPHSVTNDFNGERICKQCVRIDQNGIPSYERSVTINTLQQGQV